MELENTVQPGTTPEVVEETENQPNVEETENKPKRKGKGGKKTEAMGSEALSEADSGTESVEEHMTIVDMKIKRVQEDAVLPTYGTEGSGALDFYAAEDVTVWDERTYRVGLGVAVEVPKGFVLQLVPRSSIGMETPLRMPNSMGVIDSDYRGEVAAIYVNDETKGMIPYQINKGDRIAQGYLVATPKINLVEVEELSDTDRGDKGFGSTGK